MNKSTFVDLSVLPVAGSGDMLQSDCILFQGTLTVEGRRWQRRSNVFQIPTHRHCDLPSAKNVPILTDPTYISLLIHNVKFFLDPLHYGLNPIGGPGHGSFCGIIHNERRQHPGYRQFTQQPDAGISGSSVWIAFGVPDPLGILQYHIPTGLVEGEFHIMARGMGPVLVNGGNFQQKFRQDKRGPGNGGGAIMSGFPARAR